MVKFVCHVTQLRAHPTEFEKRGMVRFFLPSVKDGLFFISVKTEDIL